MPDTNVDPSEGKVNQSVNYSAPSSSKGTNQFRKFWELGYKRLIPITPPGCEVSERSSLAKRPKDLGKAPGVRGNDYLWRGIDWGKLEATEADLDTWQEMGAGVGVKTGQGLIVIDIDTLDKDLGDICGTTATKVLGHAENRVGRSPKRAKCYRVTEAVPYQRLKFDGGHVELLSDGKQFVVSGLHPATGRPYEWPRGIPRYADLREVTPAQIADYFAALAKALPAAKHEVSGLPKPAGTVEPVQLEGKADDVRKALAALPNDERFGGYAEYQKVAQAIKGALPDDDDLGLELFQQWAAKWTGGSNDADTVSKHWKTTQASHSLGASYLFNLAAQHSSGAFTQAEAWFTTVLAEQPAAPGCPMETSSGGSGQTPWNAALAPRPIGVDEWHSSRTTPPPIVDTWFYEDVGHLAAPGGVGKTTLLLFQAVHVVLGRALFGHRIERPGPVVYLTAEDDRGTMVARLREMCSEMKLAPEEIDKVRANIFILDVSGLGFTLTKVDGDAVVPGGGTLALVDKLRPFKPTLLFVDPMVSFGVGEGRVNDAEQGLIVAARVLRNELGCGVLFVHHTGKENARNKTLDQYTGRGGSALSDGSRMTHVMQSLSAEEWSSATGDTLQKGESGIVYARPKISAAEPNQPPVYLKRKHFTFTSFARVDRVGGGAAEIKLHVASAADVVLGTAEEIGFSIVWEKLGEILRNGRIVRSKARNAILALVRDALGDGGVEIEREGRLVRLEAIQAKSGRTAPWVIKRTEMRERP